MDKNLFDRHNSAIQIKHEESPEEPNDIEGKYTRKMYEVLINHAKKKSKIIAVKIESEINIPEVKVVKVLMN